MEKSKVTADKLAPPKPGTLDHSALEVKNLQEASEFYMRVLGLKELQTPENVKAQGIVWLQWGDGSILHLVQSERMTPPFFAHIAISVDDIAAWRAHVIGMGVNIESPKMEVYSAKRFFVRDPSGNRIELVKWLD